MLSYFAKAMLWLFIAAFAFFLVGTALTLPSIAFLFGGFIVGYGTMTLYIYKNPLPL